MLIIAYTYQFSWIQIFKGDNQIFKGGNQTWTIYFATWHSIGFSLQEGQEWAYNIKNISTIFWKTSHKV